MHYYKPDGRAVLDGAAGMWCCNLGHNREPVVRAIQRAAEELDYAPPFQFAHPQAFSLATRIADIAPGDLDHVFFCNSGSEAVDTALKIALAYQKARGAASSTIASSSARCSPASTTCRIPTTARSRHSRAASPNGARISRMSWSGSSRCTIPRPSQL
jgi:acetylornithine/succinyldiaminopimelate/putrescine aminotransferase